MKFSTKMRYGTRALVELARAYPDSLVSVGEAAEHQEISAKYLEQIMGQLKCAGIVRSTRGVHGGYQLAVPPEECPLSEIFLALEGSPAPVDCVDDPECCDFREDCPTRETWVAVKEAVMGVLQGTTLQDLLDRTERCKKKGAGATSG